MINEGFYSVTLGFINKFYIGVGYILWNRHSLIIESGFALYFLIGFGLHSPDLKFLAYDLKSITDYSLSGLKCLDVAGLLKLAIKALSFSYNRLARSWSSVLKIYFFSCKSGCIVVFNNSDSLLFGNCFFFGLLGR